MSDTSNDPVTIDHCGIVFESGEAIKFRISELPIDECWIPRSKLLDYDDSTFEIPEWLAIDRGLV